MTQFFLKNNKGEPSVTLTAFVLGFVVVNLKLLTSGMVIGGVTLQPFTGTEYGVALAALGAIYVLRKNADGKKKEDKPNE